MASRFHAARQRRAERSALISTELNLVPLVDVLVSILFFSLLSYTGAVGLLTSFDLRMPPVVVTRATMPGQAETPDLLLVVRIQDNGLLVEHTGGGGFSQAITGADTAAMEQFRTVMRGIKEEYPTNEDVTVVPDDATSYERLIAVLEGLKQSEFDGISLTTRARSAAGGRS